MKRRLLPILLLLIPSLQALSQEKDATPARVYADLQLLSRGEIRDGGLPEASNATGDHAAFVMGRTRLDIGYQRPHLEAKAVFQHAGIWGETGKGSLNIQQAWVKFHTNGGFFAQLGRMALAYDDERIIGPNDWSMAGITHDVLRAGFEGKHNRFHLVLAFNQNSENTLSGSTYYTGGALPYKTMHLGWYHYDLPVAPLGLSLLAVNIGMQGGKAGQDEHIEWQQMVGGYAKYSPAMGSLEGSYYRQMGTDENGSRLDAWMASVKGSLDPWKILGFDAGYDFLSGDKAFAVPGPGQIGLIHHDVLRGFNPIYGSHHAFYGAMDFFYVSTYVNGFTPGLQNAFVGMHVKAVKDMLINLSYHYLAIATQLEGVRSPTLGHELEMEASWRFMKDVSLSLGVSYMAGTDTMQFLKRASEDGRLLWCWISLTATPRLFSR